MSDGRVTIQIAYTPPSLNDWQRAHWAKAKRVKDEWQMLLRSEFVKWGLPRNCERIKATVVFRFPTQRRRDLGNFQATLEKFLGDALQPSWLSDDTHDRFTCLASISDEQGPKLTTISLDYTLAKEEAA
jgi:hypothetical protein